MLNDCSPSQSRRAKIQRLLEMRAQRITRSATRRERRGSDIVEDISGQQFPLTDLQAAHFVAKSVPEVDPVGCHMYLEFLVADLDIERLERAFRRLIAIHPMLRARVDSSGTQQIPPEPLHFTIPRSDVSKAEFDRRVEAVRTAMSHRVYQPGDWPLFNVQVTRAPGQRSRVHVSMDAWICDGASATILYKQWYRLYSSEKAVVSAPDTTFREFVLSAKERERTPTYARSIDYWTEQLADRPSGPILPYSGVGDARPAAGAHLRRRLESIVTQAEWMRLKSFITTLKVSPSIALLGTLIDALSYPGQKDRFALILSIYNRPRIHPGIDDAVGPFSSTTIFVAKRRPELSLAERLSAYQNLLFQILEHSEVSGPAAGRAAGYTAQDARLPAVFTSALGLGKADESSASWLDNVIYAVSQTPGIDLDVQAFERADGLHLACDFTAGKFVPGAIEDLFGDFVHRVERLGNAALANQACVENSERADPANGTAAAKLHPDWHPMTTLQRAYAAQRLMSPEAPAGRVFREFDHTSLDTVRLQKALNRALTRHRVLRSVTCAERAALLELPIACYRIAIEDLRGLDESALIDRLSRKRAALQAASSAGLEQNHHGWPPFLVQVSLIRHGHARVHVVLDMLYFDAYGTWMFYQELFRGHDDAATSSGTADNDFGHPPPAKVYARNHTDQATARRYWEIKFGDLVPGPRWPWPIIAGSARFERISRTTQLWSQIKDAVSTREIRSAAVLLCLFAEALHRWSRCDRLTVVAVTFPARNASSVHGQTYGDFSSLAFVSSDRGSGRSLAEIAIAASETLARDRLYDHEDPFVALRGRSDSEPGTASFNCVLTDCTTSPTQLPDGISDVFASACTPGVDLDLTAVENSGTLGTHWQIREDRIPRAMAAAIADEFIGLLEGLALDSGAWERALSELAAIPKRIRLPVVNCDADNLPRSLPAPMAELNLTDAEYDREQCLHKLFEKNAALNPGRAALILNDGAVTYGQVDWRANQIARLLERRGIGGGSRVGVLLDHSPDMVICAIAILKAGGALVPLSHSDPENRIAAIARRANIDAVISNRRFTAKSPPGFMILCLDEMATEIDTENGAIQPSTTVRSDDVAYVMFTSGSTGEPKGVVMRHRPVVNLIEWAKKTFAFTAMDRVLFVNALGFDLAIFDIFGLLAYGGSIRVVSEEDRLDGARLAEILVREPITFWNTAPAYLQYVVPHLSPSHDLPPANQPRLFFLSGDRIPLDLPSSIRRIFSDAQVISLGGATEAAVWSNVFPIGNIDPTWQRIPYGRPIQNARYYVLDDGLVGCPVGTPGQLYIGGECLSSGYANATDLTARHFLPDPFHERPNMTMFRTGDLAVLSEDGNLDILGRIDEQIKLRGFRIEPREIEAALAVCGLAVPVAVLREDTLGGRRIVAFGTSPILRGKIVDPTFWSMVAGHLPEHMIPSEAYGLATIPMTPNGKVDRKRLATASLDQMGEVSGASDDAAGAGSMTDHGIVRNARIKTSFSRDAILRLLTSVISDALGIDSAVLMPDTHFSTLGVNSLHFAVISAKLSDVIGIKISPAKLFHCTSIDEIIGAAEENARIANAPNRRNHVPTVQIDSSNETSEPPSTKLLGSQKASASSPQGSADIAITGLACRLPQAADCNEFWARLVGGCDCLERIPASRWDWRAIYGDPERQNDVTFANRAGFIRDIDQFDAAFFGVSPREAEVLDPRQRLLLEGVWQLLEHAGYRASDLRGDKVGVFIGATGDEYASLLQRADRPIDVFSLTGSGRSLIANRLSYFFGWRGPSEVIDTTCSSSLVALHNAVRAIQSGDCSMAVVGGINLIIDAVPHLSLSKIGVLSPDGFCKTFDAGANGYARGEGFGLVFVKPLDQAEVDCDDILAVVVGTAVNHGGRANALTAPNPSAQAFVIQDAHRASGLPPDQIGYIEAHGTGTPLGDPIEIEAIKAAFHARYRERDQDPPTGKQIAIGSVKSNIGHLEAAAGIAGLIKTILMLRHKLLTPTVHLKALNPQIDVGGTPFYFPTQTLPWSAPTNSTGHAVPRAAGISSFGLGGVNAHAVLREYVPVASASNDTEDIRTFIVPLSAPSRDQLQRQAAALREALARRGESLRLGDVARTMQIGREPFQERAAILARSFEDLAKKLDMVARYETPSREVFLGHALPNHRDLNRSVLDKHSSDPKVAPTLEEIARAWTSGAPIDWHSLRYGSWRRTALPGLSFVPTCHWPPGISGPGARFKALRQPSAERDHDLARLLLEVKGQTAPEYALTLCGDEPFVRDHLIARVRVLPAAAYIALAWEVVRRRHGSGSCQISGVAFTRVLRFVDELPVRLRLSVAPHGRAHQLVIGPESDSDAREYCSAILEEGRPEMQLRADIDELMSRCTKQLDGGACYEHLESLGLYYGPSLRVIRELRYGDCDAVADVVFAENNEGGLERMLAAIDSALQTLVLLDTLGCESKDEQKTQVPFCIASTIVYDTLPREVVIHAQRSKSAASHSSISGSRFIVATPQGAPLISVEDCIRRPLETARILASTQIGPVTAVGGPRSGVATELLTEKSQVNTDSKIVLFRERWLPIAISGDAYTNLQSSGVDPDRDNAVSLMEAWHVAFGLPGFAEAMLRAGYRVLANAVLPGGAHARPGFGSAVPWESVLAQANKKLKTITLWYNQTAIAALPVGEQLRFGFDTVFDLTKRIMEQPGTAGCRVIVCIVSNQVNSHGPILEALCGFARTAQHEKPGLTFKIVRCSTGAGRDPDWVVERLSGAFDPVISSPADSIEHMLELTSGKHAIKRLVSERLSVPSERKLLIPAAHDGVTLITGGAGAIGRHLARAIVQQGGAVALVGRRPEREAMARWAPIDGRGGHVRYFQVDVTDHAALKRTISTVSTQMGRVRGVAHCAGVSSGGLLMRRSLSQAREVVAANVIGTVNIDEVTLAEPLDFFVLFSSLATVLGPVGAGEYVFAKTHTERYAAYRNELAARGLRRGKTLSVGWPLWADGGMTIPSDEMDRTRSLGFTPIDTERAIDLLAILMALPGQHWTCACGEEAKLVLAIEGIQQNRGAARQQVGSELTELFASADEAAVSGKPRPDEGSARETNGSAPTASSIRRRSEASIANVTSSEGNPVFQNSRLINITGVIKEAIARETNIPVDQLRVDVPFERYGVESVLAVAIVRRLEQSFGELSKALLFEFQTIEALVEHLDSTTVDNHTKGPIGVIPPVSPKDDEVPFGDKPVSVRADTATDVRITAPRTRPIIKRGNDIAIIGISGRFPLAPDLDAFWRNLAQGRDCITEIPLRLWDWKDYWDPQRDIAGKSYSKWGGFIDDSDCFDPLFFNISNMQAEQMDPQERVFLETVHHALEDAGYTRETLSRYTVGLYVAAMWGSYQHYGVRDGSTDSSFSSIANRASYFFGLTGPSIALDTTCSGSMTALHLACEALKSGDAEMAIAGGVNITSHPHKYLVLSRTGFAAADGRCHSFGAGGTGYVPGDGSGALLLKPLTAALASNDRIHAVIKATSINHGGRSSGFTVPSAEAQTRLIKRAFDLSGINARTIGYVEAHAPGTPLGDPIEIRGLTKAFREHTDESGFCAIGSVKSNIGHLESAAGFAGIAKVIMQLRYRQIAPSLHSKELNPEIRFETTPFYVPQAITGWPQLSEERNGSRWPVPRRAAVSAFGAGGSNAHVILEEYSPPHTLPRKLAGKQLIVLSAKTDERLRVVAENLMMYLSNRSISSGGGAESSQQSRVSVAETVRACISKEAKVRIGLLDNSDLIEDFFPQADAISTLHAAIGEELHLEPDPDWIAAQTLGELIVAVANVVEAARPASDDELLEQIAYTLQIGREAMRSRLATVVENLPQLRDRLQRFLNREGEVQLSWSGKVSGLAEAAAGSAEEESYVKRLVVTRRIEKLGRLWCEGVAVPWSELHFDPKPKRIALPLYPFARERCWVERGAFFPLQKTSEFQDTFHTTDLQSDPAKLNGAGQHLNGLVAMGRIHRVPRSDTSLPALDGLVYRARWVPLPPCSDLAESAVHESTPRTIDAGGVLFIYPSDAASLADALKGLIQRQTYDILMGSATQFLSQHSWEIDVNDENALVACLNYVGRIETVYFLGGCLGEGVRPGTTAAFDRLQTQSVVMLYRLVKALESLPEQTNSLRLVVVTRQTSAVLDNDLVLPFAAGVLGLTRSLARECPRLECCLVDLGDLGGDAWTVDSASLKYIVEGVPGRRELAVRAGQAYGLEIAPYDLQPASQPVFRRNGRYVLIGGAGVVGKQISRHLAQTLSAHLVWIGRSPLDDNIAREVAQIETLGGKAHYHQVDATDVCGLVAILDQIEREIGRIDGVAHMTMVHEVSRLRDLNEAQFKQILAAKVDTTFALYLALRHRDVGFVTLFSSAESYVGNAGWAPYAGSCSFQDAFALYWARESPYSVVSLNWGYWEGIVPDVAEMLAAKGIKLLSVTQGTAILERALANRVSHVAALNVDEQVLAHMGFKRSSTESFVDNPGPLKQIILAETKGGPEHAATANGISLLGDESPASAPKTPVPTHAVVANALINHMSAVLKIAKTRFELDADLIAYGIDSLTVVALHKTLEKTAGTLPATLFITSHSISALATFLLEKYPVAARALAQEAEALETAVPGSDRGITSNQATHGARVRRIGRFDPLAKPEYLASYGARFREGSLESIVATAVASPRLEDSVQSRGLDHLLIDTPSSQGIEVLASGRGVPVVLLPAVGLTAPTFRNQLVSGMTSKMRLAALHPPGYGLSKPIRDCTAHGVATAIGETIDFISPNRPVHILASCLGCVTALHLARFSPWRIASLTLIGAFYDASDMIAGDPDQLTTEELNNLLTSAVDRMRNDFASVRHANGHSETNSNPMVEFEFLLNCLCANALVALRYLTEMLTLPVISWLPGITAPTQCIYGTNDRIVSPRHSKAIAGATSGAKIVTIEGGGHFPYLTHGEEFNELVERFILQHENTAPDSPEELSSRGRRPSVQVGVSGR
jgi:amino acid adenylation domain-containing protein